MLAVVRQPIAVAPRTRRRLEERVLVRLPRVRSFLSRLVWRLPARSRLRQVLLRRAAIDSWESFNRGDFEVAFAFYGANVESTFDPKLVSVGLADTSGRDARVALQRGVMAQFGVLRYQPEELVDLDDGRLLIIGRMTGAGLSSGVAFDNDWAVIVTVSGGWIVREEVFLDRADATASAGLPARA
jgi:ketosteroid isomerase-like protein